MAGSPSKTALLLARSEGKLSRTEEEIPSEMRATPEDRGVMRQTTAARIRVYKRRSYGWTPIEVPATNLAMVLSEGMRPDCGDCLKDDCQVAGYENGRMMTDINGCSARPKFAFRRCPECQRKVYDVDLLKERAGAEAGEGEIVDDAYASSTPELRTKIGLDQHIIAFHPQQAPRYGLAPVALRDAIASPERPGAA